ncbi:hypothetical protein ACWEV4_34615, partial [Streptomyces sp. NPDC003860]
PSGTRAETGVATMTPDANRPVVNRPHSQIVLPLRGEPLSPHDESMIHTPILQVLNPGQLRKRQIRRDPAETSPMMAGLLV